MAKECSYIKNFKKVKRRNQLLNEKYPFTENPEFIIQSISTDIWCNNKRPITRQFKRVRRNYSKEFPNSYQVNKTEVIFFECKYLECKIISICFKKLSSNSTEKCQIEAKIPAKYTSFKI